MKFLAALLALCVSAFAQQGSSVNQVNGFPNNAGTYLYFYNGSNQVTTICYAPQLTSQPTVYTIGATPGLVSIAVSSNTATATFSATAQLWVGQQITVSASGTTALNGTYKTLTVSGSTATFTTSGVSDGTYNTAGTKLSTSNPVLNANVWAIQVFTYVSTNLTGSYYAGAANTSVPNQLACSNRANY